MLRQILRELDPSDPSPLGERALAAAEAAARVLWQDRWELRVEAARRWLDASIGLRRRRGAPLPKGLDVEGIDRVIRSHFESAQESGSIPKHVDWGTWLEVLDLWIAFRDGRQGKRVLGEWAVLAKFFDETPESLKKKARKAAQTRRRRGAAASQEPAGS